MEAEQLGSGAARHPGHRTPGQCGGVEMGPLTCKEARITPSVPDLGLERASWGRRRVLGGGLWPLSARQGANGPIWGGSGTRTSACTDISPTSLHRRNQQVLRCRSRPSAQRAAEAGAPLSYCAPCSVLKRSPDKRGFGTTTLSCLAASQVLLTRGAASPHVKLRREGAVRESRDAPCSRTAS
jgi:hypothetical protein